MVRLTTTSWAVPTESRISSSSGVNLPQSSPKNTVPAVAILLEDPHLAVLERSPAKLACLVVLEDVVHWDEELVLGSIQVAVLLGIGGVRLFDRHLGVLLDEHFLGLVDPDGLQKPGPKPAQRPVEPNDSLAKFWMRIYSERVSVFSSLDATAR